MKRVLSLFVLIAIFSLTPSHACGSASSWVRNSALIAGCLSLGGVFFHAFDAYDIGRHVEIAQNPNDKANLKLAQNLEIASTALQAVTAIFGYSITISIMAIKDHHKHRWGLRAASFAGMPFPVGSAILSGIAGNILKHVQGNDAAQREDLYRLEKLCYLSAGLTGASALALAIGAGNSCGL